MSFATIHSSSPLTLERLLPRESLQLYLLIENKIRALCISPESYIFAQKNKSSQEICSALKKLPLRKHLKDQINTLRLLFFHKQSLLKEALASLRSSEQKAFAIDFISAIEVEDSELMAQRIDQLVRESNNVFKGIQYLYHAMKPITFQGKEAYRRSVPNALFTLALGFSKGRGWGKPPSFERIGNGSFGNVYRISGPDSHRYALKHFLKPKEDSSAIKEAYGLSQLTRAISFIELADAKKLILEYADGGDLKSYSAKIQKSTDSREKLYTLLKPLLIQAILALKELNENVGWIHKDVKSQNFLLSQGILRLIDLNLAQKMGEQNKFEGTFGYEAPEVHDSTCLASPAMDIWSFGVMMCKLFTGISPFKSDKYNCKNNRQLAEMCKKEELSFVPIAPFFGPKLLEEDVRVIHLIGQMLSLDPKKRPSWDALLSDPFFTPPSQSPYPSLGSSTTLLAPPSLQHRSLSKTAAVTSDALALLSASSSALSPLTFSALSPSPQLPNRSLAILSPPILVPNNNSSASQNRNKIIDDKS